MQLAPIAHDHYLSICSPLESVDLLRLRRRPRVRGPTPNRLTYLGPVVQYHHDPPPPRGGRDPLPAPGALVSQPEPDSEALLASLPTCAAARLAQAGSMAGRPGSTVPLPGLVTLKTTRRTHARHARARGLPPPPRARREGRREDKPGLKPCGLRPVRERHEQGQAWPRLVRRCTVCT